MSSTTAAMRRLLTTAGLLVVGVGVPLYLLPDRTDELFSWTIHPPLSAAFLGGSYLAAAVLEFGAARRRRWEDARIAVPAVFVFTVITLGVTLGHLDAFHFDAAGAHTRAITWIWLAVYVVVPPMMAVIWVRQARSKATGSERTAPMALPLRTTFVACGVALVAIGAVVLVDPAASSWAWPWDLTPLVARAVAAWLLGFGVALAHAALGGDWTRAQPFTAAAGAFAVLQTAALIRYSGEPDWGAPQTWVHVAALMGLGALGVAGHLRRRGQAPR